MSSRKTVYRLPIHDIVVTIIPGTHSGTITSALNDGTNPEEDREYCAAIDGLEALILAMACEGIKIDTAEMIAAIETAVDSITNNF